MSSVAFHTTASVVEEFIPPIQDVALFERTKREELESREYALCAQLRALPDEIGIGSDEDRESIRINDALAQVNAEWAMLERNIATMKEMYPTPQRFFLAVPTSLERDMVTSRLLAAGYRPFTQEVFNANIIETLFEIDWDKGSKEANEVYAEELANFVDSYWQRAEAHNAAQARWQEQEIERILDEREGAPTRPPAAVPEPIISVREDARFKLVQERVMATERMGAVIARNADQNRALQIIKVRLHVIGVENVDVTSSLERNPRTKALSEEAANEIRASLDDISWAQLLERIEELYNVTEAERKNSVSPAEKPQPPSGSDEQSSDMRTNGGPLTTSSIDPAPEGASETITENSSGSGSASDTEQVKETTSDSPTAVL